MATVASTTPKSSGVQHKTVVISQQASSPIVFIPKRENLLGILIGTSSSTTNGTLSVGFAGGSGAELINNLAVTSADGQFVPGLDLEFDNVSGTTLVATLTGNNAGPIRLTFLLSYIVL